MIYGDTEAFTEKIEKEKGTNTMLYEQHKVSGVGIQIKSRYKNLIGEEYQQFDTIEEFFDYLKKNAPRFEKVFKTNVPMKPLTADEEREYNEAKFCHICKLPFDEPVNVASMDFKKFVARWKE